MKRIDPASYLFSGNASYLTGLQEQLAQDPQSLPEGWETFLKEWSSESDAPSQHFLDQRRQGIQVTKGVSGNNLQAIRDSLQCLMMIRAYRVRGHMAARLDPLELEKPQAHPDLQLATYGFSPSDLDREIFINGQLGFSSAKLRDILAKLLLTYCGAVGVEYMHIQDPQQRSWIQNRLEGPGKTFLPTEKKRILELLWSAEAFERFLHVKFPGAKRFSLEGGESMIPAFEFLCHHLAQKDYKEVIVGMAHRGRLNLLTNGLHKPFHEVFAYFKDAISLSDEYVGSGDVKYHLGYTSNRTFDGKSLHLSLTANPSHLEAVNPVVLGKVRAKQNRYADKNRNQVMGILFHGDAAFAGQGLVFETLGLSGLKGYRTGGIFHVIINNQIGFTTSPPHSRSSPYSSDVAKSIQAPIFHINGDDPEAVISAMLMAEDFRETFQQDVVIDMVCYRRHGHNEGDEPNFTQPLMYQAIAQKKSTPTVYADKNPDVNIQDFVDQYNNSLKAALDKTDHLDPLKPDWLKGAWEGIRAQAKVHQEVVTGLPVETLKKVGHTVLSWPKEFNLHAKIVRQFEQKRTLLDKGTGLDWAMGEALAFGTLIQEGCPVRLSGQDTGRGTFSQRHAVLTDQNSEERYLPLSTLGPQDQLNFEVVDSPLAEASVLGFEYGYTTSAPNALVLWEGQFGDFANGAQVIIDQFIASAETKWQRFSGLVMLLPHGYEGQGPEHSSARLERYLQMCAEDNIQVANCSTPANYFHILRRQLKRDFRKPLILMTPKSLLRHPQAVSTLDEMGPKTSFQPVIVDKPLSSKIRQVVLCSGKVYYDLFAQQTKDQIKDVLLVRLEQYYPFPEEALAKALKPYVDAQFVWCQEEPENMGAWTFLDRRLEKLLQQINAKNTRVRYAGRREAAATATGLLSRHIEEQNKLVHDALSHQL